ncbi:MAG: MFS transporter [Firmicutes bacterium]|nr:MFS transporter [Bacillota bacterium]
MARNVGYGVNKVFAADLMSRLTRSQTLIGLVLGMEGFLGLILNPLTGWMSDRFALRWGRRRIFVLISTPLAAVFWLLFAQARNLHLAELFLISFYFFQQVQPTPYQAWMPDIVRAEDRGRASGVLNLWWQVGNFLAFLPIPLLWKVIHQGAFWVTALLMILGGAFTGLTVRDPGRTAPPNPSLARERWLTWDLGKYFFAQFLWWLAFEGLASFFTLFVIHTLHGTLIDSALGMSIFTLAALAVALGFGRLYRRYAPKRMMIVCLGAFGLLTVVGTVITSLWLAFGLLFVAGVFWGGIQVVSYPWGAELLTQALGSQADPTEYYGLLYGLGNVTQSLGLLVAAPITGLIIALAHGAYGAMFWVSVVASLVGTGVVAAVRETPLASSASVSLPR